MLHTVLKTVQDRFNDYMAPHILSDGAKKLMLGDITKADKSIDSNGGDTIQDNIVLSIVNIEEETNLRNNFPKRTEGSQVIELLPTLHLNIYALFSCNFTDYIESLKHIGFVLQFFQATPRIEYVHPSDGSRYELVFNLHCQPFDQMNNLWMVLGGRYVLSALYRVRLVWVQESAPKGAGTIQAIRGNEAQQ